MMEKVILKYDQGIKKEEVVHLEIPIEEFEEMLENDYQYRLANAVDGEMIERRTAQEFFDDMNRNELNSWRKNNRRLISVKTEDEESSEMDMMDLIVDDSQARQYQKQEDCEALCQEIRQLLKPKQAEMIITIDIDGMGVKDYATQKNLNPKRVSEQLNYTRGVLRKKLLERKIEQ